MKLFNKVGGKEILWQYARSHILLHATAQTLLQGLNRKGLEIVRLSADNKRLRKLRKTYSGFIKDFISEQTSPGVERAHSKKVWICWLQGMENAPDLVKRCYRSVCENMPDREIILLTEDNYRDYVRFPDFIQEKIESGVITKTHMSDLLRLELLIRYGGTWIDATVFCSGPVPSYMLDSDLFVFQLLKPGADGTAVLISSWFMTACSNHPILLLTRALLYQYWKKNNHMIDYFLLHDFFQLAIETYPEEWKKVVPFSNSIPHILLLRLFEPYDENIWNAVKQQTSIHKLTYKFTEENEKVPDTYYQEILK